MNRMSVRLADDCTCVGLIGIHMLYIACGNGRVAV